MAGMLGRMLSGGKEGAILGQLLNLLKPGGGLGGVQGLISKFEQNGMGEQAKSWVSGGENQQVSGEQVQQALGQEHIQQVAKGAGVSESEASGTIAKLLPHAVDELTPNQQVPQGDDLTQKISGLAGKFLGRAA